MSNEFKVNFEVSHIHITNSIVFNPMIEFVI